MAYSQYEDNALASPVRYYSEDYDYPTYYQTIPESKHVHQHVDTSLTNKRFKNNLPTVRYVNEKCPIYVHPVHRYEKYPTYDLSTQKPVEKGAKEITNPKSVLDKLEETYWATWKPKKEDIKPVKHKNGKPKNKAIGDHEEEIIKYFSARNFEPSSASVIEKTEKDASKKCLKKSSKSLELRKNREQREKEVDSQEIQTDDLPMILPKTDEDADKPETISEKPEEPFENVKEVCDVPVQDNKTELQGSMLPEEKTKDDEVKAIKHTDSFILTKRKQANNSEEKPHFQQPRSIRLFRKPGATSSSYIKGGSYPLKPCLKKESPTRGNFRLGAPGSSLFVTTSSYNKKNKR